MPTWMKKACNQDAVYWASPTHDGSGGTTFSSGTEIKVRWEDRIEEFLDNNGEVQHSMGVIYLLQDVDVGGYLFLGDLDDLTSAAEEDPKQEDDAYLIRGFKKSPSIKGSNYTRKAWV